MIVGAAWVVMPDAVPKPSAGTCVNYAKVLWLSPSITICVNHTSGLLLHRRGAM
jgi:hypothetical protein